MASGPETVSYGWPIASNFPKTTFISNAVPVFKRLSAMVLFLHPGLAFGSEDSLVLLQDWLPLSVGDRWIYQADMRDGNRQHPEIRRWQQEETITAIRTLPEGVLIERKVKFLNNTIPPSWVQQSRSREAHILFHDACLYYLGDSPSFGPDYGWSSTHHEFTASFRQALARNAALPDICMPLQPGKTWGDPKKGRNLWMVAGRGKKELR